MTARNAGAAPIAAARGAGWLYLAIIVCGLVGELVVRTNLIVAGDAPATAANVLASTGLFRLGFLADSIMFLCDVALAGLLYMLFRPVSKVLALVAMSLRLAQAAVLALNLLHYYGALLVLEGTGFASGFESSQLQALSYLLLDLHGHGYDLGLLLFGLHCLLLGSLVWRSGFLPRILGALVAAAGVVYLIGSYTRFLFPAYLQAITPIYAIALVAELGLCLWLLIKGVDAERWNARVARAEP